MDPLGTNWQQTVAVAGALDLDCSFPLKAGRLTRALPKTRQVNRRDEGTFHVDAQEYSRDRADGGKRRLRGFPHSGYAPSPYPPLWAGWAQMCLGTRGI